MKSVKEVISKIDEEESLIEDHSIKSKAISIEQSTKRRSSS